MPRIAIKIPYSSALSKNVALKRTKTGISKSKATSKEQERIWYLVKGAINATKTKPFDPAEKVWVRIMVYRRKHPHDKGKADMDPINTLDTIADAVKLAIDVDDDVFSAVVDWDVDEVAPRIEIVIEQGREGR